MPQIYTTMAKSKNRKKTKSNKPAKLSKAKFLQINAHKYPWHQCFININWESMGMAVILMLRKMPSEKYILGSFMVDVFCLGVKDSNVIIGADEEMAYDYIERSYANLEKTEIDSDLAQNIIWGALEYAEDIGFQPPKKSDFEDNQYILDPADEIAYIEITFGKDGKPFYFEGPHDNTAKVIATLEKNVGADNYHFVASANKGDMWQELDDNTLLYLENSDDEFDDDDEDEFDEWEEADDDDDAPKNVNFTDFQR